MAMSADGKVVDPFMGRYDIEHKAIRCVGDADKRFTEDPLRILRACRFRAQLPGFHINNLPTRLYMGIHAEKLQNISSERIRDELTKILVSDDPISGLISAYYNNVTAYILPEFDRMMECKHENPFHYTDVGHHSLDVVKGVPARANLRWAALLHDVGKPDTKAWDESKGRFRYIGHPERSVEIATEILDRLKFSNADKDHILKLIQHHDFTCETPSKLRRFAAEMGKDFFEDFYALQYADAYAHTADYAPYIQEKHDAMRKKIDSYFEDGSAIDVHGLKINGDDLIMIGLQGKQIGEFLNKMLSECLGQPSHNNKEYLVKQALKWAEKEIRKQKFKEHHQESNTDNR
jgi:tRNA nucleotidyltransferase (CCA-adding enzyme)